MPNARLRVCATAKGWAHKITLASMSSVIAAMALLEFTPNILSRCPPIGYATIRRGRLDRGGQDLVDAGDLLESGLV